MDVPFAVLDFASKAQEFVKYVLAVVGGFIVGNLLTLILCRVFAHWAQKQKMPDPIERALRVVGGIVVAALVAFLLFPGGWGGGSGEGEGKGGPTSDSDSSGKEKQATPKVDPKSKEDPAILASGMKVTILRGKDYPKSYLFEGETEGVDFAMAKEKLRKRLEDSQGQLKFVDVIIYRNSTAEKSVLIESLEEYAHDLGLRTSRKKLDQLLPE